MIEATPSGVPWSVVIGALATVLASGGLAGLWLRRANKALLEAQAEKLKAEALSIAPTTQATASESTARTAAILIEASVAALALVQGQQDRCLQRLAALEQRLATLDESSADRERIAAEQAKLARQAADLGETARRLEVDINDQVSRAALPIE